MEQIEFNTPDYQGRFWGEKNLGFDAMFKNMKGGSRTTSEFLEFVKEFTAIQETYQKSIVKLNNKISSYNSSSFKFCWGKLHKSLEIYTDVLNTFNKQRQLFLKEIQVYSDEQSKKQRSIKDDKSITETINAYQSASDQLQKAKESFRVKKSDYLKLKQNDPSTNRRDLNRAETKLKKAQQDLKYSVDKYNNLRTQYINKMKNACIKFQSIEEVHLAQMLSFLKKFIQLSIDNLTGLNDSLKGHFDEIQKISTGYLINLMLDERGTGDKEPQEESFDDQELISLNLQSTDEQSNSFSASQISDDLSSPTNQISLFSGKKVTQSVDGIGHQPRSSSAEKKDCSSSKDFPRSNQQEKTD